jgi:hypothetical protein
MSIGETIFSQLGGNRFRAMTGAKMFTQGPASLTFRFGRGRAMRIELTPADLYDVTFYRKKGKFDVEAEKTIEGAYAEDLRRIFEDHTGLRTSL